MRHIDDAERRARLGRRHALAPGCGAAGVVAAAASVVALHATEPASVHLAARARVPDLTLADVERALYDDRAVVKQLAMRRTLWAAPRDLLPALWGSASARVAATEHARMAKDVAKAELRPAGEGERWVEEARAAVLDAVRSAPDGLSTTQVREAVPMVDVTLAVSPGAVWGAARVLTHLGLTADLVRGRSLLSGPGQWRVARYAWTPMERWIGAVPDPADPAAGWAEIVRRWLSRFGPGTEDDLVWWTGSTKGIVRAALATVGAVEVSLDGGAAGWVLPEDVDPVPAPGEWVALLPVLDPSVMGWKGRAFYLGGHGPQLFDRNGNGGSTAWVDGRVVGCWTQDDAGRVVVTCLEDVDRGARQALDAEARRLTDWLDGVRIGTVYPSPAMKTSREPTP